MIYDIMENGFVFISDTTAVPIFSIKAFQANDEVSTNGSKNNQKENQKDGKKWKPITHNKKMHRRMGHQGQGNTPIVPIKPIKPEEILKTNIESKTNEIGEIC